jgi:tRNA nucleotidyltransferase (CCA-adding enzyme)
MMNNNLDVLRERVLAVINPTNEEIEKQQHIIQRIITNLEAQSKKIGESYSFIEAQGSTGKKQTQLRGAADIDIFVAQDPEHFNIHSMTKKERKSAIDAIFDRFVNAWYIPVAKSITATDIRKTYSQHPYLSMKIQGIDIDIVGCFDLTQKQLRNEGPITAVDRTVHHSRYVCERIDTRKREDARILKSFVKASHTYGDIPAVGWMGFPGYALELMVLKSDSLDDALQVMIDLQEQPLDTEGRSKKELSIQPKFQDDEIFIMDPTDIHRNVASSIDIRSYRWTRIRAERALRLIREGNIDGALNLIVEKPIPTDPIPNKFKSHLFSFEFADQGKKHYTILRDKIQSVANRIRFELEKESTGEDRFGKVISELIYNNGIFALGFLVQKKEISEKYEQRGPASDLKEAVSNFQGAHTETYEKDGYYWTERNREWVKASKMVEHLLAENPIQGLLQTKNDEASIKVLNILTQCVFKIEPDFELG